MFAGDKGEITDFVEGFAPVHVGVQQFIRKAENNGKNEFFKAQAFMQLYQ